MKFQYEQHCNTAALKEMGVSVLKKFKKSNIPKISRWIDEDAKICIKYPHHSEEIIDKILQINFNRNWSLTEEDLYADLT